MKSLQIDETKAKELYPNATPEFQAILEDTFGKKFFKGIPERIKSYEDACKELNIDPEDLPIVKSCQKEDRTAIIAFHKLTIIARAINEGWTPNWADSNEYKYYPWFEYSRSASCFVCSLTDYTDTITVIGSRLCFKTREIALYFGQQFLDLFNEYLLVR